MSISIKWARALVLVLLTTLVSFPALANVGRVLFSIGVVNVEAPEARVLSRGATVNEGDVIVTGPRGYAQIVLADGTKIAIRPDSRFVIEGVEAPAEAGAPAIGAGNVYRASFNLERGGFRTITGSIARRQPTAYQVRTPSAVISVRGTNYSARLCEANCATDDGLYVGVSDGGVTMSNNGGALNLVKSQYGYAPDFNTPPSRLVAPPASLTDEPVMELEETEEEESSDESSTETAQGATGDESGESDSNTQAVAAERTEQPATTPADTGTTPVARVATVQEPAQEVRGTSATGGSTDLTGGADPVVPRPLSYSTSATAVAIISDDNARLADADDVPTAFENTAEGGAAFAIGTADLRNVGFDSISSIRWGRWSEGVAIRTDAGGDTSLNLEQSSLHFVEGPVEEVPVQAITGSASYVLVGNTDPTDNAGNRGILGSASLSADFTNATVSSNIQLGVNNQNWQASGSGAISANLFSGSYSEVRVNGASGGSGSFGGFFSGLGAAPPTGAGLNYRLVNGTTTVNGAAVFNQGPGNSTSIQD
ncbi:MAG: FecR domain-containing protein [Pseudomonadota bacterium]